MKKIERQGSDYCKLMLKVEKTFNWIKIKQNNLYHICLRL